MRLLLFVLCLHSGALAAAPRVVTSIAPVQEITAAIMHGVAEPEVIIESHASVHHFALKPSQMRRLQQADLVIWVTRHFESGFNRLAEILPATTRQLELLPAIGVDSSDGHFWYAPDLLHASIDAIVDVLQRIDPANAEVYRANASGLAGEIEAWRERIGERWAGQSPEMLADHDFTHHFTRAFGFEPIDAIHDQHDDHAGLKKLSDLEHRLRERGIRCLLTQTAEISPLGAELAQKYRLRVVDLGTRAELADNRGGILGRLDRLRTALDTCA